jgi:hypothetical protein
MNTLKNFLLLATLPLLALAGCGGGDTEDRLDLADPTVRFVQASPIAPHLTLFKGTLAQSDATDVGYKFASDYFDIGADKADWSVKTTVGSANLGSVTIDPLRGTKYTIVALASSDTDNSVYLIVDPFNKPLTSDSTRLRVMNASFNAANIDLYLQPVGASIATVAPLIAGTAFKTSGPASGDDSVSVAAGDYQVTITPAGSKTVLFRGPLSFGANKDVLLLTVPDSLLPGGIGVLEKIEGTPGATSLPQS